MNTITAKITGVKYTPYLCRKLNTFSYEDFEKALSKEATFLLRINEEQKIAISWWVSAKRTRSYPYARVYDSLAFAGKKVTIIPIVKDEGANGDRDFLQWDTVSLMSLLGVYVIISYYENAEPNPRFSNKITNQRYNIHQISDEIQEILSYQSDALHWNLAQLEKAGEIGEKAIESYSEISKKLGVNMHSLESARKRFMKLQKGKDAFLTLSRDLAKKAQERESITIQPKEKLSGYKGIITITNYLGGEYFFTSDEVEIHNHDIHLIEGKHTKQKKIPSTNDIKDGLLRMILLTNLTDVRIGKQEYNPKPILKLTTAKGFNLYSLKKKERSIIKGLKDEAQKNGFRILLNSDFL